jgi:transglutaminase-like putative cysteine protease
MVQPETDPVAPPGPEHLAATAFIDSEDPVVRAFAQRAVDGAEDGRERIRRLFAAVRDEIRYDPYSISSEPSVYIASNVIERGAAYCIPKAVALTAAARSLRIPARLGFSYVRNHLQSERLAALMGTDLFVFHGYSELHLDGAWRKATPAFNAELCARFGVPPIEFDGSEDALLHAFTGDGSRHMEYISDRGSYSDLPLGLIIDTLTASYPELMERAVSVKDPAFAERHSPVASATASEAH